MYRSTQNPPGSVRNGITFGLKFQSLWPDPDCADGDELHAKLSLTPSILHQAPAEADDIVARVACRLVERHRGLVA